MGSFRSQPDLIKHTQTKAGLGTISYAVSHMCGTNSIHSGWRIYMEDAHISYSPINNSKNSLFGVFDGHGGTLLSIQELKWLPLFSDIFSRNWKETKTIKLPSMRRLFVRLSSKWTWCLPMMTVARKLPRFRRRWRIKRTVPSMRKILMPVALLMWSW